MAALVELVLSFAFVSLCGAAHGAHRIGTTETLQHFQIGQFQGFSEDLWTSQTFLLERPGHEGSGNPLTRKSAAQLGMAFHWMSRPAGLGSLDFSTSRAFLGGGIA